MESWLLLAGFRPQCGLVDLPCRCQRQNIAEHKLPRHLVVGYAYAPCRSNKGAPGVDGQDFPEVVAYGLERWLGELAKALKK